MGDTPCRGFLGKFIVPSGRGIHTTEGAGRAAQGVRRDGGPRVLPDTDFRPSPSRPSPTSLLYKVSSYLALYQTEAAHSVYHAQAELAVGDTRRGGMRRLHARVGQYPVGHRGIFLRGGHKHDQPSAVVHISDDLA